MIKANELRIGNWYDHFGEFKQASPNTILEVWEAKRTWCKPIQLTPEILEKCGFDNHRGSEYIISITLDKHLSLTMMPDGVYPLLLDEPEFSSGELQVISTNRIEHLHQLQNLVFALTGEELNYQP